MSETKKRQKLFKNYKNREYGDILINENYFKPRKVVIQTGQSSNRFENDKIKITLFLIFI